MANIIVEAIQKGREEAWELAKKIARGEADTDWIISLGLRNPDGCGWLSPLSFGIPKDKEIPIEDLLDSYNDWELQKAVKVWDEVHSDHYDLTFIVTRIKDDGTLEGICSDGACYNGLPDDIKRTGRSFPEMAELLERMNKDD